MDALLAALRAAGEPTRIRILGLLGHGELTVSELTHILRQSQPRVSRHLKLLTEAGLLNRFREGTWVFYRLVDDDGKTATLARTLVDLIPEDDADHTRDLDRLAEVKELRAEKAAAYFSANAGNWDKVRSLYVEEKEVERELLSQIGDREIEDFLDVGTGTGRMLEIFAPYINRGLGIDLSHEMLSMARSNLSDKKITNCQVRHGDMYALPVDDGSQDIVIFHQVLHYADDPQDALSEAARALRKTGTLIIVDFAPHDLEILREEHAHRRLGFRDEEIINWSRSAGLKIEDITHFDGAELTATIWRAVKPGPRHAKTKLAVVQ